MASELANTLRAVLDRNGVLGPIGATRAIDALDARDRDVAELVADLEEAIDKLWVFRCNFRKDMPERELCERLVERFKATTAKHKGGA